MENKTTIFAVATFEKNEIKNFETEILIQWLTISKWKYIVC